eukprot:scaffold423000_cov51-Attheya_sp.AAC.1
MSACRSDQGHCSDCGPPILLYVDDDEVGDIHPHIMVDNNMCSAATPVNLKLEVDALRKRLRESEAENKIKDKIIESLQAQIRREDELVARTENLQQTINEVFRRRDDPVFGAPENK